MSALKSDQKLLFISIKVARYTIHNTEKRREKVVQNINL